LVLIKILAFSILLGRMNELSTKCIETSVQFGQAIEQGCD